MKWPEKIQRRFDDVRISRQAKNEVVVAKDILENSRELHAMNKVLLGTPAFETAEFLADAAEMSTTAAYVEGLSVEEQEEARGKIRELYNMFENGGTYTVSVNSAGDFESEYEGVRYEFVTEGRVQERVTRIDDTLQTTFTVGSNAQQQFIFSDEGSYLLGFGVPIPKDLLVAWEVLCDDQVLPWAIIEDEGKKNKARVTEVQKKRFAGR